MTRLGGGLGLGLFIVRAIAEMHHGSVSVHSDGAGTGATFSVQIPLAVDQAVQMEAQPALAGPVALDGLRVLVVDDDPDALDLLHHCLQASGAHVETASSAAQALKACSNGTVFDAVVSDLAMPQQSGFQFLASLRQMPAPTRTVPVIALTAHASDFDGRRALESGFQLYLSKPIDPAAVALAIRSVVAHVSTT